MSSVDKLVEMMGGFSGQQPVVDEAVEGYIGKLARHFSTKIINDQQVCRQRGSVSVRHCSSRSNLARSILLNRLKAVL